MSEAIGPSLCGDAAFAVRRGGKRVGMANLAIYLNDHLAGATLGTDLAKRSRASNEGNAYGTALADLAREIEEDRDSLLALMEELDVPRDRLKVASAWAAEKVGRLKLNGSLFSYSPLSRLVELEGLSLGVTGKRSMWENLKRATPGGASSVDFDALIARADSQLERLVDLRTRAAAEAF
jgi:hypothetical protein